MFSSADDDGDGTANEDCVAADVGEQLDQYHESHNAPVPYPTMHHFGIEMVHRTCRQIRNKNFQVQVQKSFISIVTYQEYKDSRDWNPAGLICPHHLTITYIYMMTS